MPILTHNLNTLVINNNPISALDVSHMTNLQYLECMQYLFIPSGNSLRYLNCSGTNLGNSLDLQYCEYLTTLYCNDIAGLGELDFSHYKPMLSPRSRASST